jgi:two-component system chemotaxis sensor kinase CheA
MDLVDYVPMFLAEGREHLQNLNRALVRVEQQENDGKTIAEIFRIAHSLKGMSSAMGYDRMASLTHEMESVLEALRERGAVDRGSLDSLFSCVDALERMTDEIQGTGSEQTDPAGLIATLRDVAAVGARPGRPTPAGSAHAAATVVERAPCAREVVRAAPGEVWQRGETVRVEVDRLDMLTHLAGELVVQGRRVESLAAGVATLELQAAVDDLARAGRRVQTTLRQVRLAPVETVFARVPRMVRDLATQLGKSVELRMRGQATELDRAVLEALADPLVQLVRNALDHGLESSEEREAAGKPAVGTLELSVEHAADEVVIRVRDDGRGVDPAKVGLDAVRRGLLTAEQAEILTMDDAVELLFAPGLSTAPVATGVSGRGVGMDVVRTTARRLGGDCFVTAEVGRGSCATIRLPLRLAVGPPLLLGGDGEASAAPVVDAVPILSEPARAA